jgi:hypothetical protein
LLKVSLALREPGVGSRGAAVWDSGHAAGSAFQDAERAALAAGFDAHMIKPVDLRKLSAAVDDLLLLRRH